MFMSHLETCSPVWCSIQSPHKRDSASIPCKFATQNAGICHHLGSKKKKLIAPTSAAPVPPSCLHSLLLVCEGLHGLPSQSWDRTWQPARARDWHFGIFLLCLQPVSATASLFHQAAALHWRRPALPYAPHSATCSSFCPAFGVTMIYWMVPGPLKVHAVIEPHCHFWILDHGFIMDSKIQSPGMSEMLKIAIVIFLLHHCLTARTLQGAMLLCLSLLQGLPPRLACFCILAKVLASSVSFLSE